MKYRLEKLNQVQYADDEDRKKELEAKGFKLVGKEDSKSGVLVAGNSVGKPIEGDKAAEKPKAAKKTTAAGREKNGTSTKAVETTEKSEKGEDKDKDAGKDQDQVGIVRLPEE